MSEDAYLRDVAILVQHGFRLNGEIWDTLPWDGDMPEDFIEAFAMIYRRLDNEKLQKLVPV